MVSSKYLRVSPSRLLLLTIFKPDPVAVAVCGWATDYRHIVTQLLSFIMMEILGWYKFIEYVCSNPP